MTPSGVVARVVITWVIRSGYPYRRSRSGAPCRRPMACRVSCDSGPPDHRATGSGGPQAAARRNRASARPPCLVLYSANRGAATSGGVSLGQAAGADGARHLGQRSHPSRPSPPPRSGRRGRLVAWPLWAGAWRQHAGRSAQTTPQGRAAAPRRHRPHRVDSALPAALP